ncbi:CusA/CzcA family heavy metal efflux RND transporter [Pollutibacter soli]|uniref:CusA/CzcA family heavy metal efflux RND transporter n=1 Tax=Pollutibacter soli TaxID=3034157 RepID=UPI003013355E
MLNAIIRFSVRNKLIVGVFTLGLLIYGVIELFRLPIDALPDITSNQVQVITVSPSLAAPEVERLITFPLEQASSNIPGIKEMRSISRFGLSVLTIAFDDDIDIYWARQQVSERLSMAREQIPAEAGLPELGPATTGLGEIYQYVLRPAKGYEAKFDLAELRSIQDWIVRRQLLGTPGIADVSSFGGYLKQYEVAIIPDRLKGMNVTVADVFNALEKNNQNSGGAYIEKGPTALFIRTEGLAASIADIEKIVVRYSPSGIPVYIRDVAEVRLGHAIRYGALTFRDKGEVAGAVVLMLKGANASEVITRVKDRIEQIRKTLPEGVILETFYDRTKMVNNAIGTVKKNLLEGALIVIFVLVIFLGNLRAGLIVASVIPLSMLFAIIMMNFFGVSGNLMSLGALDFGLIVDGAVIIVEAVLHRISNNNTINGRENRLTQLQMDSEVQSEAGRMMNSAVFGQAIILIVYLPILTLTGIEGKMFKPMAQTVSFALVGAFLLSLTYVPMVSSLFLSKKVNHKDSFADRGIKFLQRRYRIILNKALGFPKTVVSVSIALFGFALWIMSTLGGEFIPELEEGDFAVDTRLITGSSLTETIKTTQKAVAVLEANFPEVEKIVTRIGASEIPTDPMPIEMTDIMISLKPKSEWTTAKSSDELANKMSRALEVIPGMSSGFQFPVQMRFNELISGARQDIVCKIFGDDLDSLATYANKLGKIVQQVSGAKDIYIETITGLPQIVVTYRRDAIALYQLNIADINQVIRTAFAGAPAGLIYEKERRFELVVRLNENLRNDLTDVRQLLIPTPQGQQIPLYQVADVQIKQGPNQIQRENAQRRIIVGFNVRGRDIESVVGELRDRVDQHIQLPSGYFVKYGGQFENMVEAKSRLSIAVPAALLLILLMLYFAFGSLKYGILIFSAIPLSAIGGVLALWVRDMPFSISAGVGFIALFGVAVLNGIVLITEFNRLKQEGLTDTKQIILEGTGIRLRPVLMTAAVAALGFIPMAVSNGSGAEVQRPLATVVIGGLVTATLLTLIVLPVLYTWAERKRRSNGKAGIAIVFVLTAFLSNSLNAQTSMSLEEMTKTAEQQNLTVQGLKKQTEYWNALRKDVFDPSKTVVGGEFGNINSAKNDTRFFIGQTLSLPPVYKRQRALYEAEGTAQIGLVAWRTAELQKEVKIIFYQLAALQERRKRLIYLDSVYERFLQAATIRLQAGETSLLEKTTAEAQLQQLKLLQQQSDADLLITQQQLQLLLNSESLILPVYESLKRKTPILPDSAQTTEHPQLAYSRLLQQSASAQTETEKSKLLPDFTVGYSNQSIVGYQSLDGVTQKYFTAGDRFHIVNLSAAIPIFNKTTKAKVRAGQINEEVARINTMTTELQISNRFKRLHTELLKHQQSIDYYEKSGLTQAALMIKQADLAYRHGEISYLEWTVLMNNAVQIQLQYINIIQQYNETVIELEYLTGK